MTWSDRLAPSLDDFAVLAKQAFDALPDGFRHLAGEVVIRVDDFPSEEVLDSLEIEDARELARSILDAVFQGRTQHVLSQTTKVAVVFNPNGFVLRFGEGAALRELFIGSPAIIRLAQGILRMTDRLSAMPAH